MELFAYQVKFNEEDLLDLSEEGTFPDSTFNSFVEAFYSVFILLANDGWSTIYVNHYRATNGFKASSFFLSLLLIGQFIMLNLFLAILLDNFDEESIHAEVIKKLLKEKAKK